MKVFYFLISILFIGFQQSWAQARNLNSGNANQVRVKNVAYLELAGNAIGYSFNYERRLSNRLWGRIGVGYAPVPFVRFAALPLGVSYLFGNKANFLEAGLVTTFAYADVDALFDSEDGQEFGVILSPTIGYRFQPQKKNLFFKIAFTPLFTPFETKFLPSGGLSLGYSF